MSATTTAGAKGAPNQAPGPDIADWRPEDDTFWNATGKKIAYRNLWISVPALLCGFAVWGMWGIITVQMLNLGFPFTQAELFTLTAIAGISGATMRIPASFLIRLAGGRNTIFLTTAMLLAPAIGTGIVLQHKDWPLWAFQLMALWSGVGGGNFASSMSNISTFFPKRLQGTALGLNAGLGNFGVTTMQIVIPLVMTVGLFGAFGGEPMTLVKDSGWIFGKIAAGTPTWIQNAGFAWVLSLVPLSVLCWWGMNNLKTVSPATGSPARGLRQDHLPVHAGLRARDLHALAVPAQAHRPGAAEHVGGHSAGRHAGAAGDEAGGLRRDEGGREEAVRDLQQQAHLVADRSVHRHLRFVHRLLDGAAAGHHGDLRLPAHAGCQRRDAARAEEPERAVGADLRLDRPLRRRRHPPLGGWISDKVGGSIVTQVISVVMAGPRWRWAT
jgi:NNP family nitrate/nitrite transporter-like MFS transporter